MGHGRGRAGLAGAARLADLERQSRDPSPGDQRHRNRTRRLGDDVVHRLGAPIADSGPAIYSACYRATVGHRRFRYSIIDRKEGDLYRVRATI